MGHQTERELLETVHDLMAVLHSLMTLLVDGGNMVKAASDRIDQMAKRLRELGSEQP